MSTAHSIHLFSSQNKLQRLFARKQLYSKLFGTLIFRVVRTYRSRIDDHIDTLDSIRVMRNGDLRTIVCRQVIGDLRLFDIRAGDNVSVIIEKFCQG